MSQELISKKDLLDLTGISYGQLYRWKRKNLIPEDWFIRKSTFTGQETFFPKDKILERIDKIQTMKENLSLDELADMFSPNLSKLTISREDIKKREIASETVINFFVENSENVEEFTVEQTLVIYILEQLLQSGDINFDEGKMVLQVLMDAFGSIKSKNAELIFIRKFGMSSCLIISSGEEIFFEKGTKVVTRVFLTARLEELKTKWI